jgi:hypothetical protein
MRYKTCEVCERTFRPARRDARFCSQACKQRAYRRRVDPEVGSIHRERQRQTHINITKQETRKQIVCAVCGWEFERSILETNRIYCSNACKQRAYRARKREAES